MHHGCRRIFEWLAARMADLLGRAERSSPEARKGAPQARDLTASARTER
jgi:hypothetical protein